MVQPCIYIVLPASIIGVAMNVLLAEAAILFGLGASKRTPARRHWI
jgi:hypothetical protein